MRVAVAVLEASSFWVVAYRLRVAVVGGTLGGLIPKLSVRAMLDERPRAASCRLMLSPTLEARDFFICWCVGIGLNGRGSCNTGAVETTERVAAVYHERYRKICST